MSVGDAFAVTVLVMIGGWVCVHACVCVNFRIMTYSDVVFFLVQVDWNKLISQKNIISFASIVPSDDTGFLGQIHTSIFEG